MKVKPGKSERVARRKPVPKTAIIFQGGAARGAFQLGAMKYLDEIGVKPDIIIGSSIGVINACLYASGGIEKMEEFWTSFKGGLNLASAGLHENVLLGNSLFSMRRAFEIFEGYFDFPRILESSIEVSFILTNLSKGTGELRSNRTEKTWEDLRTISRIGYTVPGLYPPIEFKGDYWCDGGFVWNVPFEYALKRGAKRIFMLLCIGRSLPRQDKFKSIYQVLSRFYDVMWVHAGSSGIMHRDFSDAMYHGIEAHIVEPTDYLGGFGLLNIFSFHPSKAKKFIEQGYRDARAQIKNPGK
ncbi:patatin-like phospholipase family protein [Candidatus Poribacteria bacterium]|nr:patatin-like phospholipase family protein [Candidatus Poribacteria bacterium]